MGNNKSCSLAIVKSELEVKLFDILFSFFKSKMLIQSILFFIFFTLRSSSFSQNVDSTKVACHFDGAVIVLNNGISFIPTFSLRKPAAIFDLSAGKKQLSFDPLFRFTLTGKPWSFFFWWRYKLVNTSKVAITLGAHPAYVFKTITTTTDSVSKDILRGQRYLAGELSPNYFHARNMSIGMYYLYSHGIGKDATQNAHFFTLNCKFYNIKVTRQFFIKFISQVYHVKMDKQDGFYFTSALTLANRKIPISLLAVINKIINTDITAVQNFVWNINHIYSVHKKYKAL